MKGAVHEASVAELQLDMATGELDAGALVSACLERIEAIDRQGPELRSVIEINPDALTIAESLDRERRAGHVRGPLHGIPVLIKDNVDTADRTQTTAGSLALAGSRPRRDAFIVTRLRAAGAIPIGKANLSEWANFRGYNSTSGWSARGGQCKNPYVLDHNPGGSSSGSCVAVAAGLVPLAVGTETDGSIAHPAATCSVVGIKPTVGRVSRTGLIPVAQSQDTAGPIARGVADAALLLSALSGPDPDDAATTVRTHGGELARPLETARGALRGARLGVPRAGLFGYSADADAIAERALDLLEREGAEVVDPVEIPHRGELRALEIEILLTEFKAGLNAYLAARPDARVSNLCELIDWNERNRDRELVHFGQELFELAETKPPLSDPGYRATRDRAKRLAGPDGLGAALDSARLDALVAPTTGPTCRIDPEAGDVFLGSACPEAAIAGFPHVTVPAGYVSGLPIGLSFIGRPWSEPTLLRLAHAFESALAARRPPTFRADLTSGDPVR